MGSILGEEVIDGDNQDSSAQGEKIFVAIRLRPLNERELSKNDVSEWDCINNTTIIFKNSLQERSLLPTGYTFDRVFGYDAPTRQVYDEAAKKIALSALSGINSTIFAYGQTSSGKTYTMSGVTEYAVTDIYDYISKHDERRFTLKFSAIEIYNESVRDLLCADSTTTLRLLDDPERGTVIDKLTEVSLRDANHLKELLSICEAQRQIGETTLNEMSSRSHQILRLTIESETRHYSGALNASSLTASVNFVDLAGSERASQTLSAGTRLKEGCHINRSLLTLGTVIRKLGKGRNAHIPYRDSKLTRILQNSLGGNARTAIICTMSPAHSHVEQSRNTLLFASCAKQVSTNASVNVVMSEKALVKQLQRELARLENELRNLRSLSAVCAEQSALQEKELLIQKMNKEMQDLISQRDFAQSRIEDMTRHTPKKSWDMMHHHGSWTDEYSPSEASDITDSLRFDVASAVSSGTPHSRYERALSSRIEDQFTENNDEQFLSDDTSPRLYIDKYFGPDPCKGWEKITQETIKNVEDNSKEVQCIEIDLTGTTVISKQPSPEKAANSGQSLYSSGSGSSSPRISVERSKSCEAILTTYTERLAPEMEIENENAMQNKADNCGELSQVARVANTENLHTQDSLTDSVNEEDSKEKREEPRVKNLIHLFEPKPVNMVDNNSVRISSVQEEASMEELDEVIEYKAVKPAECDSETISTKKEEADVKEPNEMIEEQTVRELNEVIVPKSVKELDEVIKSKTVKKTAENDLRELSLQDMEEKISYRPEETTGITPQDAKNSGSDWQIEFERQKREIIELWDACHIPLIHRTYFFLLFQGDPSDAVYMEVELRRLFFLKNTLHGVVKDDQLFKQTSSSKALNREREMLSRILLKKFSAKEREALFKKWGIHVKSKQRRLQLCRLLWSDPKSMEHINDSAAIVAKLVGFKETGQAPKEMFGLSFSPKPANFRSFNWRHSLPL